MAKLDGGKDTILVFQSPKLSGLAFDGSDVDPNYPCSMLTAEIQGGHLVRIGSSHL
jgi:hypothetical protein